MTNTIGVWRERLTSVASGTEHVQESDKIPELEWRYLECVGIRNDTTVGSKCLAGIWDGAYLHTLYYFDNVGANVWTTVVRQLWLRPGERLRFEWSNITSGDRLDIHISGHRQYRS